MAFITNRFCWHGCVSTDTESSKTFYQSVIGWTVETLPMGDSEATFFAAQDKNFAHLTPPMIDGVGSHWNSYLRVDDVDKSAADVVANGGQMLSEPMDIPPGRFCPVTSPSGAAFSLFHEADPSSEHHPGGDGSVMWVELHSQDAETDLAWLVSTFGYTTEQMAMPDGTYNILKSGDVPCGGVMTSMNPQAPSSWLVWFQVPEVDKKLTVVEAQGGSVIAPAFDVPNIGRMAIVSDPTGGMCGLITPAVHEE
jgi:predicted enzyme related to lactoylglutathione lyase